MGKYTSTYRPVVIDVLFNSEYYELQEGEYLTLWGMSKRYLTPFKRVKVVGFVTNTYLSPDRKYGFVNVDDGTGIVMVKFFKDALRINEIMEGDCVAIFGRVSRYNDEIHIINEDFVKIENLNYFILHRLEFMKEVETFKKIIKELSERNLDGKEAVKHIVDNYNLSEIESSLITGAIEKSYINVMKSEEKEEIKKEDIKAQVIEYIKAQQGDEGVEYTQIIKDLPYNEEILEEIIVELLSEGSCYEPRPGQIKLL